MFRMLSAWHLSRRIGAAGHGSPLYAGRLSRWLISRFDAKAGLVAGELFNGFQDRCRCRRHCPPKEHQPRSEGYRTTRRGEMLSLEVASYCRRAETG